MSCRFTWRAYSIGLIRPCLKFVHIFLILNISIWIILIRHRGNKNEYSLNLKIKRNDWLPADTCPQAANHALNFEFEIISRPDVCELRTIFFAFFVRQKGNINFLPKPVRSFVRAAVCPSRFL